MQTKGRNGYAIAAFPLMSQSFITHNLDQNQLAAERSDLLLQFRLKVRIADYDIAL